MSFIDFDMNVRLDETMSLDIAREILKKTMILARNEAIIQASKNADTGELISKIQLIEVSEDEYILESGALYSEPIEYGTVPYWAPIGPLKEWAKRKTGDEDIGYAIQKKIAKEGISAHPFMRPTADITTSIILPNVIAESKSTFR